MRCSGCGSRQSVTGQQKLPTATMPGLSLEISERPGNVPEERNYVSEALDVMSCHQLCPWRRAEQRRARLAPSPPWRLQAGDGGSRTSSCDSAAIRSCNVDS